ncbi:MAG: hypothetical protein J0I41_22985 [Filimonas sp.]|nr:hypothetical protein [Filimonas sp.]
MDLFKFLRLLYRRKWLLICIPVITVIITYFLVRYLPDQYTAKTRIATGIADPSQQILNPDNGQESKISQEFSNLIQMMLLKKMVNQVSYQLMIHDLSGEKPFKAPSKLVQTLSPAARNHATEVYKQHYNTMTELSLWNKDEEGLYKVLKSMQYDYESLTRNLSIYRVNSSDFIDLEFTSTNPELSAYVLNTLVKEFVNYYSANNRTNQLKAVNFLDKLLKEKQDSLNAKMDGLKKYKIDNRVLNLNEQAKSLYGQLSDFETRREIASKDVIAYTAALKDIDNKFSPTDRRYLESSLTKINADIVATKQLLNNMNDDYVKSNFDEKYKRRVDSLRSILSNQVAEASDKYITNPLATKQDLITQKMTMQISLELARNSIGSIDNELARLNRKFDGLVPHEAVIQGYENSIDVASREYLEILAKYNQASMQSSYTVELRQIQEAMPGTLQPSKKMLLIILSGIISFVFCVFVMFVLFYFDNSISEPKELALKTDSSVLGKLSSLRGNKIDLKDIWQNTAPGKDVARFKNELRALRFEIDQEMGADNKVLVITGLQPGEGRTFLAISLAYAYAMTDKKILLIDGNFTNPSITGIIHSNNTLEDYLSGKVYLPEGVPHFIQVLGNKGHDTSLSELTSRQGLHEKMVDLKKQFDIIIIEAPSLQDADKAKEWILQSDKTVAVFDAGSSLNEDKTQSANYLSGLGKTFAGWILNKAEARNA